MVRLKLLGRVSVVLVLAAALGLSALPSFGDGRSPAPKDVKTEAKSTPMTPAERVEQARSEFAAQIAQHPNWPQRPVQVRNGEVWVPMGPKDPADYRKWVEGLAYRGIPGGADYVADQPGVPTMAELENAQTKIRDILERSATKARNRWNANLNGIDGTVHVTSCPTSNQDSQPVLDALAQIKRDYGSMVVFKEECSSLM